MSRWFVTLLLVGCSDAAFELPGADGPIFHELSDLGPFAECPTIAHIASNGACLMEWACVDAGTLVLSCSGSDGGVTCACADDRSTQTLTTAPSSCADVQQLTAFARAQCGWSWL
jgi:hypothetical protein